MARGDVVVIDLPVSELREQSGRRPAVAVQTDLAGEPMLVVAPITSNLAALRFAFSVRVEPSPENGLTFPQSSWFFSYGQWTSSALFARSDRCRKQIWRALMLRFGACCGHPM